MNPPLDEGGSGSAPGAPQEARKKRSRPPGVRGVIGGKDAAELIVERQELESLLPAKYSEDNAALRFARKHKDDLRYVHKWGRWLRWDGARWKQDEVLKVFDLVRVVCREISAEAERDRDLTDSQQARVPVVYGSAKTVASVERFAKADPVHAATADCWDADKWALNTPGGVVNLKTGGVTPSSREALMTRICGVAPADTDNCPLWYKFLARVTGDDEGLQGFLKRIAGYSLTGSIKEHALFFLYGIGRNGKGTYLSVLQHILGDYSKVSGMDVFIEQNGTRHPTELASLMGARLVSAQETEQGKRWNESRIKSMTGGDLITARYMRMDEFTFQPQFKLVIAGNHKPRLRNIDEAIKARMNLVPFTVIIPPEERDKDLTDKLIQQEAPAILRWAINGCMEWQEFGLMPPPCVKQATEQYLSEQDSLSEWIAEECDSGYKLHGLASALYKSYASFTEKTGEYVASLAAWKEKLASRGIECKKYAGNTCTYGLDLKNKLI